MDGIDRSASGYGGRARGSAWSAARAALRRLVAARAPGARPGPLAAGSAAFAWAQACLAEDREAGRGFLWLPVGFAAGVALYYGLADEPSLALLLSVAAAAIGIAVLARAAPVAGPLAILAAALAIGAAAAKVELDLAAGPVIAGPRTVDAAGFVEAIERRPRGRVRLAVGLVRAGGLDAAAMPRRVVVTAAATAAPVAVGEGVSFRARLAPPRGPVLPGGYDPARSALLEGVGATGFVYGRVAPADLGPTPWPLRIAGLVAAVRAGAVERIRAALPGATGEIAAALLVGERGGIPDGVEEAMRVSGLAHVLSISGLHMVLVAGTIFALVRGGLALAPALALTRPIKAWAAIAAAVVATAYLVLSGAEVATQRSYVTLLVTLVAVVVGRPAISLRTVAVSALVVLALAPAAILGAGFQMSFAAVVALVAVYEAIALHGVFGDPPDGRLARIARAVAVGLAGLALTSLVAGLATAPIAAYHFHRGAPLGLLANLLAMPVVSIAVMPFGMAALALMPFGLERLALAPMGLGIEAMMAIADWVASLTGGAALVGRIPAAAPLLLVAALLWGAITVAAWRVLALAPLVAGLALLPASPAPDLFVAADGATVAARGPDGRLVAVARGADGDFLLAAWLAADRDDRAADDPGLSAGVACDGLGCTAALGAGDGAARRVGETSIDGRTETGAATAGSPRLAVVREPLALLDDCTAADVVVAPVRRPAGCEPAAYLGPQERRDGVIVLRWPDGLAAPPQVEAARPPGWRPWYGARPEADASGTAAAAAPDVAPGSTAAQ